MEQELSKAFRRCDDGAGRIPLSKIELCLWIAEQNPTAGEVRTVEREAIGRGWNSVTEEQFVTLALPIAKSARAQANAIRAACAHFSTGVDELDVARLENALGVGDRPLTGTEIASLLTLASPMQPSSLAQALIDGVVPQVQQPLMTAVRVETGIVDDGLVSPRAIGEISVGLLGLGGAGKTSVMWNLKQVLPEGDDIMPTNGFSQEKLSMGSYAVTLIDVGGNKSVRGIWKHYYAEMHAAVFVVDTSSEEVEEAAQTIADATEHRYLRGKPLLVLLNQKGNTGNHDDVAAKLRLHKSFVGVPAFKVVACNALQSTESTCDPSIASAFRWLLMEVAGRSDLFHRVETETTEQKEVWKREKAEKRKRLAAAMAARDAEAAT